MIDNGCASVRMEEGYMRAIIEYTKPECRSMICDLIGEVENELDIFPEVMHKRKDATSGTFSVEFGGSEDHVCSRIGGEFIETVLKKLELTECGCSQ